jgi:protein SDA1
MLRFLLNLFPCHWNLINLPRPALQNKIRRDPISYKLDFTHQYQQYQGIYLLFLQNSATDDTNVVSLPTYIDFIAHVADCYRDLTEEFPAHLIDLLSKHHATLDSELREKIVASLVILRNKNVIGSVRYEFHVSVIYIQLSNT